MFNFEKLRVYQNAIDYVSEVYIMTKKWPIEERFGLTDQMRRAVASIALNIAEGSSRTKKEFSHFLDLARGSSYECAAIIKIALNQKYMDSKNYLLAYSRLEDLIRQICALKRSINIHEP